MSSTRRPVNLPPRARKLPASPFYAAPVAVRSHRRRWTLYAPDGSTLGHAKAVGAFAYDAYPVEAIGGDVVTTGSLRDAAAAIDRQRRARS